MIGALSPHTRTRLEKAAADNGFDQTLPESGLEPSWIGFASTKCPLWVWLGVDTAGRPVVGLSQAKVAAALAPLATASDVAAPLGARAVVAVMDVPSLHSVLRRAFQLARTLPDAPLQRFEEKTRLLPRATEMERLVVQRIGQDVFRESLLEYWEGRCAVTALAVPALLLASHMKPWKDCESDGERLDVYNGLLLCPQLDRGFDKGLLTFDDRGVIVMSPTVAEDAWGLVGVHKSLRIASLRPEHLHYLGWHRSRVFRHQDRRA